MGNQTSSNKLHSALNTVENKTTWRKKLMIDTEVERLVVTDILPIETTQSKLYITPCGYAYDYIGNNIDVPLIDQSNAHRILLVKVENYDNIETPKVADMIIFDEPDFTKSAE